MLYGNNNGMSYAAQSLLMAQQSVAAADLDVVAVAQAASRNFAVQSNALSLPQPGDSVINFFSARASASVHLF